MSLVGLSFGSATSGDGFDVSSTVAQIVANLQSVETPWKTQLLALQAQDTELSTLGTLISSLNSTLTNLRDVQGTLAAKEGSSSNTDVLELTSADSTAVAGDHTVVVNSVAKTSSGYFDAITDSDDTLSGSITVQVGSGDAYTLTLDSSDDTLTELAAKINLLDIGVAASVITDKNGSRLNLVSGTSGSDGTLTITSSLNDDTTGTALSYTESQAGSDASLTIDGMTLTSSSNTISNMIRGVTFQLLSADPGTEISVIVENDTSTIESEVASLVSDYNALVTELSAQEGYDSSGVAEPLFGSTLLSQIQLALTTAINYGSSSTMSLYKLGITVEQNGELSFDGSTFNSALSSDYSAVVNFFQSKDSFGYNLYQTLQNVGTGSSGAITLAQNANTKEESSLNTSIDNQETLIASKKETLTTQLNEANQTLQAIPELLEQIKMMYAAITGYDSNS